VDALRASPDAIALEKALEELCKRKEDDQQRNWMLHKVPLCQNFYQDNYYDQRWALTRPEHTFDPE